MSSYFFYEFMMHLISCYEIARESAFNKLSFDMPILFSYISDTIFAPGKYDKDVDIMRYLKLIDIKHAMSNMIYSDSCIITIEHLLFRQVRDIIDSYIDPWEKVTQFTRHFGCQ